MNEVQLEGEIAAVSKSEAATVESCHLTYQLVVTHRNRQGLLRRELYPVNVWNRLAQWAERALQPGTPVVVKGYLTQRRQGDVTVTEVTASRIILKQRAPEKA